MIEMKRKISILLLLVFSFYYTNKISTFIINNSSLMKDINSYIDSYKTNSINAIINNEYIIPGLNGKKVNKLASFYNMKKDNYFLKSKIVYDEVKPDISINNNKDKIINKTRKNITIIVKDNKDIIEYANLNKIKLTRLITYNDFNKNSFLEQINIDEKSDYLLNKYNMNKNICIIGFNNKDKCIKSKKLLVEPTYTLKDVLFINDRLSNGDIIFLDDRFKLDNFNYLLSIIKYHDFDIDYLSNNISEV